MKRTTRSLLLSAVVSASFATLAGPAQAEDVLEQIEIAKELYQSGEYGAAITELQFAINDIQAAIAAQLAATFPDAPAGWTALEASSNGGGGALMGAMGGGSMLERSYNQDAGDGRLDVMLMVDNPMVQGMAAMFSNPALLASQPNMDRFRVGRETGIVKWEAERGRAEATLLLDGRILMQVNGSNLTSSTPAVALLQAWNLDQLRAHTSR